MKGLILMLLVVAQLIILIVTGDNIIPYILLALYVVVNSVWELAERK
jgi:hypothetical protein